MRHYEARIGAIALPAIAMAAILAAGAGEAYGRQYVSLLPNYSNMKSNEPLDYWTFRQDADIHNISELWDLPNAGMIESATFSNCTFRYSASDKVISYTPSFTLGAEDGEGFMELTLALDADGESPWHVSRVEIYAVNAFNPDFNYKPSFTINGIRATLPPDNTRDYCGVDFPEDAEPMKIIRFETPVNSRISFWDMKIYLRGEPQLPEGYIYNPRRTYGVSDVYTFPAVKIGTLDPGHEDRLQCSVINEDGAVVASTMTVASDLFSFDAAPIDEGKYRICFHMPDISEAGIDRCEPDPADGLPFVVEPTIKGFTINGVEAGDFAHVPDQTVDPAVSWEHAALGGLRPGVEIYWKISQSDTEATGTLSDAESPVPADFTLYDAEAGVPLDSGDRLHVILMKNDVRTPEFVIPYDRNTDPNAVTEISIESCNTRWITPDGLEADPDNSRAGTLLIEIGAGRAPRKVIVR